MQKNASTNLKLHTKQVQKESSKLKSEFKDDQKKQKKEHSAQLKGQKSLSKKDIKLLSQEHANNLEWQDLLFEQNQARSLQTEQYQTKQVSSDNTILTTKAIEEENFKKELEALEKIHQTSWEQLVNYQKLQFESVQVINQMVET